MGSAIGSGAYPRERRIGISTSPPTTIRMTESSHGTRISRSCISQPSARCESRSSASSSAKQIGSPARFPEVITSTDGPGSSPGRPNSSACSGAYASMTPRSGLCGATDTATGAPGRRGISTIGRCGPDRIRADRFIDLDDAAGGLDIGHHHGERLVSATLSQSQLGDRVFVSCVAGEVVAADALDRQHATVAQQPARLAQSGFAVRRTGVAIAVRQCGSAVRAADRLGVEPPVGGIMVFAGAVGAHRERGHRGG